MGARALGNASTSIEGDVIRIMREDSSHAAATIPQAVMSVLVKSVHNQSKHLSVRIGSSKGSLDKRV